MTDLDAFTKGKVLEDAVRAIEAAILHELPGVDDSTFAIDSNKIHVVDGVRHEIDIWVEIDPGKGYETRFIFECKNWKDKVGKNEIIVFSEKIAAVRAQKGFFVATAFTADAEAQAKKDPRTVLLIAQELGTDLSVPFEFHYVGIVDRHMHLGLQARGPQPSSQQDLDINSVDAYLGDDSLDLPAYLNRWAESMEHEELRTFASVQLPEDVYELSATAERSFGEGELLIESIDIGRMELKIKFSVA